MRNVLVAAAGAAMLLAAPITEAVAQSTDGLNRWVNINNVSQSRTVLTLYAVPSHVRAARISGRDLLPGVTIRPGQSYAVNFDDGQGTCYFDLRATSMNGDWVRRNVNVCGLSHWDLL